MVTARPNASPRPRRILHVLPDLAVGGGQQLLCRAVEASDPGRVSHLVCGVRSDASMRTTLERVGARTYVLETRGKTGMIRALPFMASVIRREGVEVIHTNNTNEDRQFGQMLAMLTGRPLVNTIHSICRNADVRTMADRMSRHLARCRPRRVIAVSEIVRSTWLPVLVRSRIPADHVHVVHPGLDLEAFDAYRGNGVVQALRAELAADGGPLLVNVARLHPGKGQADLVPVMVEVVRRWPSAVLAVAGDGPERPALERAIRAAGLGERIRLLGDRDDVPALLAAADVLVFPSLDEGFGLVALEAMAAGTAVVAYDLPALREFVEPDASASLVATSDSAALSAAVVAVLDDTDRRVDMGRKGRAIVEDRFALRRSAEATADIYDLACGPEVAPPRTDDTPLSGG